jgi:hypothetical protein
MLRKPTASDRFNEVIDRVLTRLPGVNALMEEAITKELQTLAAEAAREVLADPTLRAHIQALLSEQARTNLRNLLMDVQPPVPLPDIPRKTDLQPPSSARS